MTQSTETIEVRPKDGRFEVLRPGHRRGLCFDSEELAVEHASALAPRVVVLNRTGKVEREFAAAGYLDSLVTAYYEVLGGLGKDGDAHWRISECWSYGRRTGWIVEHDGDSYQEVGYAQDGPHPSREEAEAFMAEHLRAAIALARERDAQ